MNMLTLTSRHNTGNKLKNANLLINSNAFTLLEVMIAIAIIAIAFTSLFGSQSHSLSMASESSFNTTAAFLSREKIAEYEAGLIEFISDDGDFGEDFSGYSWKAEVQNANLEKFELLDDLDNPLMKVVLTLSSNDDMYTYTTIYYGRERVSSE